MTSFLILNKTDFNRSFVRNKKGFTSQYKSQFQKRKAKGLRVFFFYSPILKLKFKLNSTVLQSQFFKKFWITSHTNALTPRDKESAYFRLQQPLNSSKGIINWSKVNLQIRANNKAGLFPTALLRFYRYRLSPYRYATLDSQSKNRAQVNKAYGNAKRISSFLVKNNYWSSDKDQQTYLKLYWHKYNFMRSYDPYSYLEKKYKLFFNWSDKHVFKRYPIINDKYTISYLYPCFADYRHLFKNQLKEQQLFRWLFRLKYQQLVDKFKKSVSKTKRTFEFMFLNFFEMRMDTVIYRLNFAFSLKQAKQWVNRSFFTANGKNINRYSYHAQIGDVIMPNKHLRTCSYISTRATQWLFDLGSNYMNLRLFFRQVQMDQYSSHYILNERVPAGLIVTHPDPYKVRFSKSFSVQFLTLSMNKYS